MIQSLAKQESGAEINRFDVEQRSLQTFFKKTIVKWALLCSESLCTKAHITGMLLREILAAPDFYIIS